MADYVTVERAEGNVAVIRLDRPKMNALSRALLAELRDAIAGLAADLPGAVVVWGGERIFAAGADIAEFAGPDEAREIAAAFHGTLDALAVLPRATIAAVAGYALGGGCELALACDLRIAADTAKFGQPEILLGIIPGGGGTQRLARLIGPSRAKDLILTGRQVSVDEALRIGLADRVVAPEALFDTALELARSLASGALAAHALAKRAIDLGLEGPLTTGLALERELFVDVFRTEDARLGVRSFLEHGPGKARFVGR